MAQIQFSLIKKIQIGRPEHSLPLPPPTPYIRWNLIFALTPTPAKSRRHMCIIPNKDKELEKLVRYT